ncbi:MAG: 30S ribosomal protein S20 [Candidatus Omnitrophica bacterium]|nr:30S ribosomal protein S20 [Candidatus Omnitrophota bacterium]
MPILKSAFKRMRRDRKKLISNAAIKAELRTLGKKLEKFVTGKKITEAKNLVRLLSSKLDKAVTKGVIHKNTASRKKSRLDLKIKRLAA